VLGIDPGSRVTGWGVVEERGTQVAHVANGTIALDGNTPIAARLAVLHDRCTRLFAEFAPDAVVLERAFVARNVQSAFRLGETRGAVLAAIAARNGTIHEYTPAEVKLATVGHGRAEKEAMIRGTTARLNLTMAPKSDAADALALALCHLTRAPLHRAIAAADAATKPPPPDGRARTRAGEGRAGTVPVVETPAARPRSARPRGG